MNRVLEIVLSNKAKTLYAAIATLAILAAITYIGYRQAGIIDTIVYLTVFGLAASIIPLTIALFGHSAPGNVLLGKLHVILGALAFGHHYLVQDTDGYHWCPGTKTHVYHNNQWHPIDDGHDNKSVLGWRPFGILRYKTSDSLTHVRSDAEADVHRGTSGDGGTVTKGGFTRVPQPTVQQTDTDWIVNLERVYTRGVEKIGDTSLIETAEQIIERGEVNDGFVQENRPMITFLTSLFLGILTGFMYVYLLT